MKYAACYPARFLGLYSQRAKENKLAMYLLFSIFLVAEAWPKHCLSEHASDFGKGFQEAYSKRVDSFY